MAKTQNSREKILDCAEELVAEMGAANLTLDAIAERASLSKGGLLYNFPSKECLLKAMIQRLLERFEERQQNIHSQLPDTPGRDLKAHILACMEVHGVMPQSVDKRNVSTALLAAIANDPKLMDPVREYHKQRLEKLAKSSLGFENSVMIAFAATGLSFYELLQISPFDARKRNRFIKGLLAFIDKAEKQVSTN